MSPEEEKTPAGFMVARAARAYIVHLLPTDDEGKHLASYTARCGWQPRPRGRARPTWYRPAVYNPGNRCPRCFHDVPLNEEHHHAP